MADTSKGGIPTKHVEKYQKLLATKSTDTLNGWEVFYEGNGFKSWRKLKKGTELYKYRSLGTIPKCTPEKYFKFYKDLKHWKTWDENSLNVIESPSEGSEIIYWSVKYPFPFSNRDYVYNRIFEKFDGDFWMVSSNACTHAKYPANSSRTRVTAYYCRVAIGRTESGDTCLFLDSFDDPQLSIPGWLMTWVTSKALPQFLDTLVKECGTYKD